MGTYVYWSGTMTEWKDRQRLYALTWKHHDDIHPVVVDGSFLTRPDAAEFVCTYFTHEWEKLVYPAKAFAVALVYAKLIERYFGADLYVALNDPDLLLGDRFFSPYSSHPRIYDRSIEILTAEKLWEFEDSALPQVQSTVGYFKREFWLT